MVASASISTAPTRLSGNRRINPCLTCGCRTGSVPKPNSLEVLHARFYFVLDDGVTQNVKLWALWQTGDAYGGFIWSCSERDPIPINEQLRDVSSCGLALWFSESQRCLRLHRNKPDFEWPSSTIHLLPCSVNWTRHTLLKLDIARFVTNQRG